MRISANIKNYQKEITEMKNTITEMKNLIDRFNRKQEFTE